MKKRILIFGSLFLFSVFFLVESVFACEDGCGSPLWSLGGIFVLLIKVVLILFVVSLIYGLVKSKVKGGK